MHIIKGESLEDTYLKLIHDVKSNGLKVSPRGMETLELHPCTVVVNQPCNNLIINYTRALNPMFMISEFLWIFAGRNDVQFISKYNKKMADFSDDGEVLHGAYGTRLYDYHGVSQLQYCVNKLREDPDTRQACMTIFDPQKDCTVKTKDFPCNHYLKFTQRNKKLDLTVYVRSQDIILGFPYDAFHWTVLQQLVAQMLGVECGIYYHIMDSAHVYSHHYSLCDDIVATRDESGCDREMKIDLACNTFSEFRLMCNILIKCIEELSFRKTLEACGLAGSKFAVSIAELFEHNHGIELNDSENQFNKHIIHSPGLIKMCQHYKQRNKK